MTEESDDKTINELLFTEDVKTVTKISDYDDIERVLSKDAHSLVYFKSHSPYDVHLLCSRGLHIPRVNR